MPRSSRIRSSTEERPPMSSSLSPVASACRRSATRSKADTCSAVCPAVMADMARAMAMWLFPTPEGPMSRRFLLSRTNLAVASSRISPLGILGLKEKSKSDKDFSQGSLARFSLRA